MKRLMVILLSLAVSGIALAANTWWVDAAHATGGTYDGKSDKTGFGTIQEAVNAASSYDTIKVLPGTYDQGGASDGRMFSRVAILSKRIRLESTGGRDVTFIVGRHSSGAVHDGTAIRCVYADTANTEIVGFTICEGDTQANSSDSDGCGGGLYAGKSDVRAIDCTFRNCWGSRGGALYSGTAIRCLFVGNKMYNGANGAIARASYLFNCIALNNIPGNQPALQGCNAVNCTFVGNGSGSLISEGSLLRNCIAVANAGKNAASGCYDFRGSVLSADCDGIGMVEGYESYLDDVKLNVPKTQLKAPALGDFRPLSGSAAAQNGKAGILFDDLGGTKPFGDRIPEADRYLDFNRRPIPTAGSICAGAVQDVAPAPVCGAISFGAGQVAVAGVPTVVDDMWFYPDDYPAQVHLPADFFYGANGRDRYIHWVESNNTVNYRNPEMDESFYVMPPADPSVVFRVGVIWAEKTYLVDNEIGDDDRNDGVNAPFRTLQKAADEAVDYSLVKVSGGTYGDDQGSSVWDGHNTRLQVGDKHIRFKGAGREQTVIEGKKDTVVNYYGRGMGPDAIRCVSTTSAYVAFQGFSFRDGCSGWAGETIEKTFSGGGAFYSGSPYNPISDCQFVDCAGYRGACNGGSYSRCDFYTCAGFNGGMRNVGFYSSCKFVQCAGSTSGGAFCCDGKDLTHTRVFLHCTAWGQSTSDTYAGAIPCYNSAVRYGVKISSDTTFAGCLFQNITTLPTSSTGWSQSFPFCANQPTDLRPRKNSPCEYSGATPTKDNFGATYHLYASTDLYGLPIHFDPTTGKPMVGCHQRPVSTIAVTAPAVGTLEPISDSMVVEDGESVTLTYTPPAEKPRNFIGLSVDGVLLPATGRSVVYTAPAANEGPTAAAISAAFSTNWYVNANQPDDSGDGFTPETAKRTLAGVMSCGILSGDCVHAAAGEYAEGGMTGHLGPTRITTNRVEVASGVTLVGDEGAEKTIIRGKLSEQPFSSGYPAYGRGPGAMRCVYLEANARIRGFTIVDGMTACLTTPAASDPDDLDHTAGGVYAAASDSSIIESCVVSNCTANRSGGVQSGTLVNCALYQNASIGSSQGDAGCANKFYGCYIGKQRATNGTKGTSKLENCTVEGAVINSSSLVVKNCLFLGSTAALKSASGVVWSVFENRASITNESKCVYDNCKFRPARSLQLDERHVPVYGACDAIDAGNADYMATVLRSAGVDAAGGQRIYNGMLDAGAYECDFRPVYEQTLGGGVTVRRADPGVMLADGGVTLGDGAHLVGQWKNSSADRKATYTVQAEAEGTGVLTGVFGDGAVFEKTFETSGKPAFWKFKTAGGPIGFDIGFAGAGLGGVSAFDWNVPGMAVFIR